MRASALGEERWPGEEEKRHALTCGLDPAERRCAWCAFVKLVVCCYVKIMAAWRRNIVETVEGGGYHLQLVVLVIVCLEGSPSGGGKRGGLLAVLEGVVLAVCMKMTEEDVIKACIVGEGPVVFCY